MALSVSDQLRDEVLEPAAEPVEERPVYGLATLDISMGPLFAHHDGNGWLWIFEEPNACIWTLLDAVDEAQYPVTDLRLFPTPFIWTTTASRIEQPPRLFGRFSSQQLLCYHP